MLPDATARDPSGSVPGQRRRDTGDTSPALYDSTLIRTAAPMGAATSIRGGHEMAKAGTNGAGRAVEWGYRGPGRPENWASLSDDFRLCGEGRRQSPIDITGYRTERTGGICFSYGAGAVSIGRDGKFVHIDFGAGNTLEVDGAPHPLASAHFHAPSEHRIDGVGFAAELHLVHTDHHGIPAVVSRLFELGAADSLVQDVLDSVPQRSEGAVRGSALAAHRFAPKGAAHFRYDGSKTTPPCDEPVRWYVMRRPGTISSDQVSRLLQLSDGPNNRPLQPIGDRSIVLARGATRRGLPFPAKIPNTETVQALRQAEDGEDLTEWDSPEQMKTALRSKSGDSQQ